MDINDTSIMCQHCQEGEFHGIPMEAQLDAKRSNLIELFPEFSENLILNPSPDLTGFRNTAKLVFGFEKKKREVLLGIYRPATHKLLDLENCQDHHPQMAPLIKWIKEAVLEFGLPVYSEKRSKGFLRYLVLRILNDGKILCCFVTPHADGAWQEKLLELTATMVRAFPEVISVGQNVNATMGNRVLSTTNNMLHGLEFQPATFYKSPVFISSGSFMQSNLGVFARILNRIENFAREDADLIGGIPRIADLYCGVGAISLSIWKSNPILLIENDPASIEAAKYGIVENSETDNLQAICGKVEDYLDVISQFKPDITIVNPPRKGLGKDLRQSLADLQSRHLYYLSCNPVTLKRDLDEIASTWELQSLEAFDMVPGTRHVECLARLNRRK
jgi:23S rRNA (uracil1939-C5)-methyltransferase